MKWHEQGYVNRATTTYLWWIEDHLPFVDEHGEPVVRDHEVEEIDDEIERFVTLFLTQGVRRASALTASPMHTTASPMRWTTP